MYALVHYENMPMQYTEISLVVKQSKISLEHIFAQNIDCGYTLELLPR